MSRRKPRYGTPNVINPWFFISGATRKWIATTASHDEIRLHASVNKAVYYGGRVYFGKAARWRHCVWSDRRTAPLPLIGDAFAMRQKWPLLGILPLIIEIDQDVAMMKALHLLGVA